MMQQNLMMQDEIVVSNTMNIYGSEQLDLVHSIDLLNMCQTTICDVWDYNFDSQMKKLMYLAQRFQIIAMDTEFPGRFISRSQIDPRSYSQADYQYILIHQNVKQTKLIQIGLSISDQNGNVPYPVCTWQFNFKFDKDKQNIVGQSYQLLTKAGVKFDKLKVDGIDYPLFAEYFMGSGMVLNKSIKWVVFHGSSDFAYLLKLILNDDLSLTIADFYKAMQIYFPKIYDLKYIIKDTAILKDVGLTKLSNEIRCNRIGPQHQAGSDALLTLNCYFRMRQRKDLFSSQQFALCQNIIFGIGLGFIKNNIGSYPNPRDYLDNSNNHIINVNNYSNINNNNITNYPCDINHNYHNHHTINTNLQHQQIPHYSLNTTGPLYQYMHQQQQQSHQQHQQNNFMMYDHQRRQ